MRELSSPVIIFDGVCNFCNRTINFIIRHDSSKKFRFASLQSKVGQQYLAEFAIPSGVDSVVLIQEGKYYLESSAALTICKQLDGMAKVLSLFIFVPRWFRDVAYRYFAKRRYQFFGKLDFCLIPTKDVRERFILDD